jgi:hypothetical protein
VVGVSGGHTQANNKGVAFHLEGLNNPIQSGGFWSLPF